MLIDVPSDKIARHYSIRLNDVIGPAEAEGLVDQDLRGWSRWKALAHLMQRARLRWVFKTEELGEEKKVECDELWIFRFYDTVPWNPD
jgi:hypothetical protein